MLEFQNVSFQYAQDKQEMMKDFNFSVDKGDFISIIGKKRLRKKYYISFNQWFRKSSKGQILIDGKPIQQIKQYSAFMPQKRFTFSLEYY